MKSKRFELFGLSFLVFSLFAISANAESYSYGTYTQSGWKTEFGEVPAPHEQYRIPTTEFGLNLNDKLYLCSLVNLTRLQCADVEFSSDSSGFSVTSRVVQVSMDIRMKYHEKQCAGTVWKTRENSSTWVLSSPTLIHGFPHSCDIPYP